MNATRPTELAPLTQSWPLLHAHSLTVRALRPEDADLEARFGLALSAESRYDRFLSGGVKLNEALLWRLVNVDFSRDMALIAVVTLSGIETPVGIARYALAPDHGAAEIAVTVADSWQGCGLGRLLLERLMEVAGRNGVRRLTGDVLATNARMIRLAQRLGFRVVLHPEGATLRRVSKDLDDELQAFVGTPAAAAAPDTEA
jgi:acetyltransferase